MTALSLQLANQVPSLAQVRGDLLASVGDIPKNSVLFGIARDGLPLLLHLRDPRPGPILVTGDQGSGKTAFLTAMLRTTSDRKSVV